MSHRKSWMVRINPYPSGPNYRFRLYATPADRNFVHSYHPTIAEAINHARHLEAIAAMRTMPGRFGNWYPEYRIEYYSRYTNEWHGFTFWARSKPTDEYLRELNEIERGRYRIAIRYIIPAGYAA